MADSTLTLLIVDDEASIRTTLSSVFTHLGYRVRSASDGFAALALIQELAPDILLSDLNMPGMSGFELLSVVRRVHPTIHVIATSASFSGTGVPHGIAADAFYEKATGLHFLLEIMMPNSLSNYATRRSPDEPIPIWISPTGKLPSNDFYVLMGCPRCLRAFPKVLPAQRQLVHEAECLHCGAGISYAIAPIVLAVTDTRSDSSHSRPTNIEAVSMSFDISSANRHNSN